LTDLTRLDPRRWILKFGFSCVFLSLAGLPPFAGFFGKLYILMNSLQQGDWVLVLLGVVTSLVSAYYYLRIVKALWFEKSESQEIFTDVISIPGNEFYSKPSQLKLFLALMFLTGFLLINKYMLIFSYHLAISCSFADAASWPSTINVL
jgi:NADH-quinone oxidoreductase subunit N